jgi:hypothetical protein
MDWRSRVLRGREDEFADQERGAGRRTIGPQVPSPRSSLPDPLTSPLIPFPIASPRCAGRCADVRPCAAFTNCAERTQSHVHRTRGNEWGKEEEEWRGGARGRRGEGKERLGPDGSVPSPLLLGLHLHITSTIERNGCAKMCRNVPSPTRTSNAQNEPNSAVSLAAHARAEGCGEGLRRRAHRCARMCHVRPAHTKCAERTQFGREV